MIIQNGVSDKMKFVGEIDKKDDKVLSLSVNHNNRETDIQDIYLKRNLDKEGFDMKRCMGCMKLYDDNVNVCPHCGYVEDSEVYLRLNAFHHTISCKTGIFWEEL